jgi:nucleoside-diphosphate-sugar epimerase
MSIALATGSAGLVGSESVRFFADLGMQVVGIDNDMRRFFFGDEASTERNRERLQNEVPQYTHTNTHIHSTEAVNDIFRGYGKNISLIIHAAAQPSHDWAASDPLTDFSVNANGTLSLLQATRDFCPDAVFRGGCLTGPNHAGTQLHGFLAYLMKCTMTGMPYTDLGYKGKQVRDNIHSADLIEAFYAVFQNPGVAEVYNIGGGRESNCCMREAIKLCQEICGRELQHIYQEENRIGDHIWYLSDLSRFRTHYPNWRIKHTIADILTEIHESNLTRWQME